MVLVFGVTHRSADPTVGVPVEMCPLNADAIF
jgi:hypothetical protein